MNCAWSSGIEFSFTSMLVMIVFEILTTGFPDIVGIGGIPEPHPEVRSVLPNCGENVIFHVENVET